MVLPAVTTGASAPPAGQGGAPATDESALLAAVEEARDHIEPEELADRLMAGEPDLVLVDVRPAAEYNAFHIPGAINVPLAELAAALQPHKDKGTIVLYSNGMTHPAQARDSLYRQGFGNVYLLTDGLQGFREQCLKPVSLRPEPLSASAAARVNAWRAFFATPVGTAMPVTSGAVSAPQLVETDWLASRLGTSGRSCPPSLNT
jgi:thiosulfate/3-mercaptopyruvate sulfurtransferase